MKKRIAVHGSILLLLTFTASISVTYSQSADSTYLKFDYVKVAPEHAQQYMEYMNTTWKPLYQKRVKSGSINSWHLYRVFLPGGARGDYNFVVVTSADGLNRFENMRPLDLLQREKQSQKQISGIIEKANSLRTIMFTELWNVINKIAEGETSPHSAKYLMIDYMQVTPGKEFDYQMLEDEFAKPIHQERVDRNQMEGWEVFSKVAPSGTGYGYNFATGNYFEDLNNIETGFTEDVIENAIPGTNVPELMNTILTTRELVQSQVWELVDKTE